jgi:hypothetical protein
MNPEEKEIKRPLDPGPERRGFSAKTGKTKWVEAAPRQIP